MYVVLSKAEKHVLYVELVGATECISLEIRCRTIRWRYNRVQEYLFLIVLFFSFIVFW